jgi:hypothetical protein
MENFFNANLLDHFCELVEEKIHLLAFLADLCM